ncbi:inversin protein alternative isoform, putative [hydrothermal vent metagenome]|uniref:Inversin protein alternative isoform, putative n=1 Tax=hydrothermal vent metagenome TaxID=652676 RepID=A0A1W1BDI3_9ZZZZ
MDLSELINNYKFLSNKEEHLKAAGFESDIDIFKVVAHFIREGNLEIVKQFIESGYDVNSSESGDFGSSLLHNAIRYGKMDIFDYLIEQGADIDFMDAVGWTPLMESIIDGKPEFGAKLVAKGADQTIANQRGANAKMLAMKFGQSAFLEFLD